MTYSVLPIHRNQCAKFILDIHYARRWPSISYAFGLFFNNDLVGVVTYGTPPSSTLRKGLAGPENESKVVELNRLCLENNIKNEASMLVGRSLRMMPSGLFVVSFADTSQGHIGTVYKASNFKYYGLSAKRTDWKVKGMEHKHGQTIADEFRGKPNRAKLMREKYGDDFYLADRPRKHRYIYVTGSPKDRKKLELMIRYKLDAPSATTEKSI